MAASAKLSQKEVDKMVEKAAKIGVAAILDLLDKWRGSRAVAAQGLAKMLSSPLDQVRPFVPACCVLLATGHGPCRLGSSVPSCVRPCA
jgi:hypothetical protein